MDFRFSDKSRALQDKLEDFFRSEVLPRNREWHAHVAKAWHRRRRFSRR